ncbi:MAG: sigma-70 family RNA polymerase sigma factor [Planctomycetota bacterium]
MDGDRTHQVTQLLRDVEGGDAAALEKVFPLVYDDLRGLAAHYLVRERPGHTLQPTALVHESFVRLVDQKAASVKDRAHFFALAAQAMRRILVEHARRRKAKKRGGGGIRFSLDGLPEQPDERDELLASLDDVLNDLGALDERQARIVELRFFGGFTIEETAEILSLSHATVEREWKVAKAWLLRELQRSGSDDG